MFGVILNYVGDIPAEKPNVFVLKMGGSRSDLVGFVILIRRSKIVFIMN